MSITAPPSPLVGEVESAPADREGGETPRVACPPPFRSRSRTTRLPPQGGKGGVGVCLPPHPPGLRIGLYGGTFDPLHDGHRHVAETALRRLGLDRVWWIVTPGNPLKSRRPADREARLAAMRSEIRHPRMQATDIDAQIGTRYTIDTIRFLQRRCPGVRFVWIMGADSLSGFDRWRYWRQIAASIPIAVIDRPGYTLPGLSSRMARTFAAARLPGRSVRALADQKAPAWVFLFGRRSGLSSTALRDKSSRMRTMR